MRYWDGISRWIEAESTWDGKHISDPARTPDPTRAQRENPLSAFGIRHHNKNRPSAGDVAPVTQTCAHGCGRVLSRSDVARKYTVCLLCRPSVWYREHRCESCKGTLKNNDRRRKHTKCSACRGTKRQPAKVCVTCQTPLPKYDRGRGYAACVACRPPSQKGRDPVLSDRPCGRCGQPMPARDVRSRRRWCKACRECEEAA